MWWRHALDPSTEGVETGSEGSPATQSHPISEPQVPVPQTPEGQYSRLFFILHTCTHSYAYTHSCMPANKEERQSERKEGRNGKEGGQQGGEELKPTVRRLGLLSDPTLAGFRKGHLKGRSPSPGAGSNQEFILN